MHQTPRILVLGSSPHQGAESFDWNSIPQGVSVADYHAVIMNLVAAEEESAGLAAGATLPSPAQFARQLFSPDSEIIVIGSPLTNLSGTPGQFVPSTWWLPINLDAQAERGSAVQETDETVEYFMRHVSEWSFFVTDAISPFTELAQYARLVQPSAIGLHVEIEPLVTTRFDGMISFRMWFRTKVSAPGSPIESGQVIWLPKADKLSNIEAVDLVLREHYGILVGDPVPEWALSYALPREEEAGAELSRLEAQLQELQLAADRARDAVTAEARFRRLLYERGEVLEVIVRDALRQLKVEVEIRPSDKEDARIRDHENRVGIVEIKSHSGAVRIRDIRQVHHWVADAITDEELEPKGILIVNAFVDLPVTERGSPTTENSTRLATRFDVAILTTSQIYYALREEQMGIFDSHHFWDEVMTTSGLCSLPSTT